MSGQRVVKEPVGGRCPDCGKVCYSSKAGARKARRAAPHRGEHMSIYRCGEYYHLGHLAPDVIAGIVGREVHRKEPA